MQKVSFVLLVAASLAMAAQGASFKSEIALLPGEVWWGGGGEDGQNQPYGLKDSRRINLRRSGATSSPLLVSSAGRYVWSEKPFEYQFAKGVLRLWTMGSWTMGSHGMPHSGNRLSLWTMGSDPMVCHIRAIDCLWIGWV